MLLLVWSTSARGANSSPLVVLSGPEPSYQQVLDGIIHQHGAIESVQLDQLSPYQIEQRDLIITVGRRAAINIRPRLTAAQKQLASYVLSTHAEQIRELGSTHLSFVFLDQPLTRQFALIKLMFDSNPSVGVLLTPSHQPLQSSLEQISTAYAIPLHIAKVETSNWLKALSRLLLNSDLLLILPDPELVTPFNAKWMIYTAMRNQSPIIGYSKSLAGAGALASLFTSPFEIGKQTASLINLLDREQQRHPTQFEISINPTVARSLRLNVPDAAQLTEQLRAQETPR